jgi:Divergent InlB B-repeat domain/PASTA domain
MHVARVRLAAATALVGALVFGGLVVAPAAHAAITGSQITTPSDPAFFIADEDAATQTFAIAGTTSGGNPATDTVDVRCYFGASSVKVAGGVALSSSGAFSVPAANLNPALQLTCRLRAVPAGTTPSNVTAFSGPVVGVGERASSKVSGGPNSGKTYDYYFDAQQSTAAFDYASVGNCGLLDGYLYDAAFANTTVTFACNAGLLGADSSATPTRSEAQVDGANAYAPAQAFFINSHATGLPTLTNTYSVDTATGNVVVHEADPLVKCPSVTYPPTTTSCSSFVSTGVTDNRTFTQDHDGHISWVSDAFTSTDSKSHAIDLLWDNSQRFWGPSGNSTLVEYEFPGQTAFSTHVVGDSVALPATSPGTILIRMHGAADGDMSTGQGAIVYDRPAAPAKFTFVQPFVSEFTLHQTGSVPAGGSTKFRFAYVQDYQAATVASLAKTASNAFLNTVAVSKSGQGEGKVKSSPAGISCGKACSHGFGYGTPVMLKAAPAKGSRFVRWSGACKGTGKCSITTTDKVTVSAKFVLRSCLVPNVVGKSLQAAKLALKRRFCSVGKVTLAASTLAKSRVISQKPVRGKRLKPNAKVSLVVSKG